MIKKAFISSALLLFAIILGMAAGLQFEAVTVLGDYVDYMILALLTLVLFDVQFEKLKEAFKQPKALIITWVSNFLLLPLLGYGLAQLFFTGQPIVALGLAIYFMAPCTDWFLGFTRMADGNVALGSVLLPINMITQLLLYPFMLQWFSENTMVSMSSGEVFSTLLNWFIVPVVIAVILRVLTFKFDSLREKVSQLANWVLYALVFMIFAVNVLKISNHWAIFAVLLLAVAVFFFVSSLITESIAKISKMSHENHVLYSMTTTARNAPMMLGLTMAALPDQPLIYATIIMGMLIEFPFLTIQVARFRYGQIRRGLPIPKKQTAQAKTGENPNNDSIVSNEKGLESA